MDSVRKAGRYHCGSRGSGLAASTGDWLPSCSQAAWVSTSLPKMVLFHSEEQDSKVSSQVRFYTIALKVMPFVLLQ